MEGEVAPEHASSTEPGVAKPWLRLANRALWVVSLCGLGLGLFLGLTQPEGERLQGPLGLLFLVLVATAGTLGLVTTIVEKGS